MIKIVIYLTFWLITRINTEIGARIQYCQLMNNEHSFEEIPLQNGGFPLPPLLNSFGMGCTFFFPLLGEFVKKVTFLKGSKKEMLAV